MTRYTISSDFNNDVIRASTLKEVFTIINLLRSNINFRIAVYRHVSIGESELFITIDAYEPEKMTIDKWILLEEEIHNL
jgi:hypothetical protein